MKGSNGQNQGRRTLWQLLLTGLCLLGFVVFLLPIFGGILNLANVVAMCGFLLLAAVFFWWTALARLLRRIWRHGWGKVLLAASGAALLALALVLAGLCAKVVSHLHDVPEKPCRTVIVLGCQVRGSTPSLLLRYRVQAAADYLTEHPEAVAVLSGGQGSGEDVSEAESMYRSLVQLQIDPARLYLEDASRDTAENLRFSMALMEREGLSGPVAIVSNDFHIGRALTIAEDLGLQAEGLAARSMNYSRPAYVLREALALVKYAVFH